MCWSTVNSGSLIERRGEEKEVWHMIEEECAKNGMGWMGLYLLECQGEGVGRSRNRGGPATSPHSNPSFNSMNSMTRVGRIARIAITLQIQTLVSPIDIYLRSSDMISGAYWYQTAQPAARSVS